MKYISIAIPRLLIMGALILMPQTGISCEVKTQAQLFVSAFLSGDANRIALFYKKGTPFSIKTDNIEMFANKIAVTEKELKAIVNEYLKQKLFRKVPDEIEITNDKIVYGGNNYTSYHNYWSLREMSYKCVENEFKVTGMLLIDGM